MALAILDGTQTATTLSTILSSGQHITAHTVVSLGTQAKTDILSAVSSGIAISGTVTANVFGADLNGGASVALPVIGYDNAIEGADAGFVVPVQISNTLGTIDAVNPLPISGTVTANGLAVGSTVANVFPIGVDTQFSGVRTVTDFIGYRLPISLGDSQTVVSASISDPLPTGTNRIGVVTIGAGTVTIGAGTAQIGSVTASLAISSTAITSGSFTSLTSATLVPGNVARKMATVYNLGAGQLFVQAGASATTLGGGFMVALSSGDFYECNYTTTTLSAIFATAGTASWVSH